jgi:TRAP-type C4-dicarboxylate transport system substrate-binding protein
MKKKSFAIGFLSALLLITFTCGPPIHTVEAKITIKAAEVSKGDPKFNLAFAIDWLGKRIEELTDDEVEVKTYHGTLGNERDMMEDIKLGTLDIMTAGTPVYSGFVKEAGLMNFAFVFKGETLDQAYASAFRVLEGPFGSWIYEKSLEKGFRIVGWWRNGALALFSNVPIRKLEDLKGLKIRTLASQELIELYKAYGAVPVAIPWPEVYSALQTGVVDGLISLSTAMYSAHMYEVVKYFTDLPQILLCSPILVSEKRWKDYPEYVKHAILQAAHDSEYVNHNYDKEQQLKIKKKWIDVGTTVIDPRPEDIKPFEDIAKKVWPKYITGEENKQWFNFMRKAQAIETPTSP